LHIQPEDPERAAGHGGKAVKHPDGRCFSGPVRPQDAEAFPGGDGKGNVIYGGENAEAFAQVLRLNNRLAEWPFLSFHGGYGLINGMEVGLAGSRHEIPQDCDRPLSGMCRFL